MSTTDCQAAGLFLPRARLHSASARASQPRPSIPSTNFGWRGYAAPWRATAISAFASFTSAFSVRVSPAARARAARPACAARPIAATRITGGP